MKWVLVVMGLLVLSSLACGAQAAVVPAAQSAGQAASITAQGAAQAGMAGVVVGSDIQSQIEGDWEADFDVWVEGNENHAVVRHGTDALDARRFRDNHPDRCQDYKCGDKFLRACDMGNLNSVTWYKYRGAELPPREDTVLVMADQNLERTLRNKGCIPWTWPEGW